MPKMKSNRAAKKRFHLTAKGKIKREHAYAGHKFTSKNRDRKRRLCKAGFISDVDVRRVKRMILA
ncbi:MAG: 50S ribosomal protein L35 [Candidatus Electryoneaceae bacterium]|nr:50S ribosomal protein L35 [Candidatus Electryoneaceae bacterium]